MSIHVQHVISGRACWLRATDFDRDGEPAPSWTHDLDEALPLDDDAAEQWAALLGGMVVWTGDEHEKRALAAQAADEEARQTQSAEAASKARRKLRGEDDGEAPGQPDKRGPRAER